MSRLNDEQRQEIRRVFKECASIRETAKRCGHDRKTVRRALQCSLKTLPNAPKSTPRKSKLNPFKAKIAHLAKEKKLSAVRIMQEIGELGYTGGYSILKSHVRIIRPRPIRVPRPPIDHPPGEEAQMDWSPHPVIMGGKRVVVHTGSIVLCYSRWIFIRHFSNEQIESVIRLHEEAFNELGAVPEIITYDNMTTVGRHTDSGEVWLNPAFSRFAEEYGFKVVILPPGQKERHGKVERPFHYIENNFLAGREFIDFEDINHKADLWRANTANVRIHGSTRERPVDRLARERSLLKPLPWNKTDSFYKEVTRLVHDDFCVRIDTNQYSANLALIGKYVIVRLFRDHLEIWTDSKLDCKHTYIDGVSKRQVLPEHEEAYKAVTGQRDLLENAFLRLGQQAKEFYEGLKEQRRGTAGYHLQRILKYADRYGSDLVAGAMAHAARYEAYNADSVLRIIQGKKIRKTAKKIKSETIPQNVRRWLRTCSVEKDDPLRHDQIINRHNINSKKDEKK